MSKQTQPRLPYQPRKMTPGAMQISRDGLVVGNIHIMFQHVERLGQTRKAILLADWIGVVIRAQGKGHMQVPPESPIVLSVEAQTHKRQTALPELRQSSAQTSGPHGPLPPAKKSATVNDHANPVSRYSVIMITEIGVIEVQSRT